MESILFLLISFLQSIMHVAADLCESFMSHFGLIRWASNKNPFTSGTMGSVDRWIFFSRFGKSFVRSRPSHFRIKDDSVWKTAGLSSPPIPTVRVL
jgi:hypothetical protein